MDATALRPGDYVSPDLEVVVPDFAFPEMTEGDVSASAWPFLRRTITHTWYVDRRAPTVGFISRDEAAIIYNTARMFSGRPCLEIGCWRGWSTAHIALGSHNVDVIDPILEDAALRDEVRLMLRRIGVEDRVTLNAEYSPAAVESLALRTGKRWSFAFVDGDHEGDAPIRDAEIVARYMADDALIIFHDLAAPEPAAALSYLRDHGWTTAVYQTMQIMGVATRGKCRPVRHVPDPTQSWSLPDHLRSFPVVGETIRSATRRFAALLEQPSDVSPEGTDTDDVRDRTAVERALRAAIRRIDELGDLRLSHGHISRELQLARRDVARLQQEVAVGRAFDDLHARYVQLVTASGENARKLIEAESALAEARRAREDADRTASASGQQVAHLTELLERATRALRAVDPAHLTASIERATGPLRGTIDRLERDLMLAQGAAADLRSSRRNAESVDLFSREVCRPRVLIGLARRSVMGGDTAARGLLAQAFARCGPTTELPDAALLWLSRPRTLLGLLRRRLLAGPAAAQGLLAAARRAHRRTGERLGLAQGPDGTLFDDAFSLLQKRLEQATSQAESERARASDFERKLQALDAAMAEEAQVLYAAQIELAKLRSGVAAPSRQAPWPESAQG